MYIVVHEGSVVEVLEARSAVEAEAKQSQPGVLFIRVGG